MGGFQAMLWPIFSNFTRNFYIWTLLKKYGEGFQFLIPPPSQVDQPLLILFIGGFLFPWPIKFKKKLPWVCIHQHFPLVLITEDIARHLNRINTNSWHIRTWMENGCIAKYSIRCLVETTKQFFYQICVSPSKSEIQNSHN